MRGKKLARQVDHELYRKLLGQPGAVVIVDKGAGQISPFDGVVHEVSDEGVLMTESRGWIKTPRGPVPVGARLTVVRHDRIIAISLPLETDEEAVSRLPPPPEEGGEKRIVQARIVPPTDISGPH